jgi:integrase
MPNVGRRRKSRLDLPPRVYVKHGAYYYVHQNNKWERLALVGEEAEMRRKWAALEDPTGSKETVGAMLDDYLERYAKNNKAPRTYDDNCDEAEYLKAYFGQMRPQDVLPLHVGGYLDIGLEAGRPVRANREKALLSHCFTWAMRQERWGKLVLSNPCRGVKRNKESKRIRIVEDWEYNAVYSRAPRMAQKLMTLVYRTLQRPEDLLKAGPRNVVTREIDGEKRKVLQFGQGKTGNRVEIIITPEIEEAIASEGNVIYPTFIHTERHTKRTKAGQQYTYDGINAMFRRAMDAWRKEVEEATKVKPKPFGIYDLKGKGATDMYQSGVPLERIQMLAGHDSITTTEVYIKERLTAPILPNQREISAG